MEASLFIVNTITAIATHYAQRGVDITLDKAKEIIDDFCKKNPDTTGKLDVDDLAQKIQSSAGYIGRVAYNEETLARFLEIPIAELRTISPENLDTQFLYDHVKLEGEFEAWLKEWNYEVVVGDTLQGLKGIEYSPDVYGILKTLHGEFEICVNFVCDDPPSEDRVFGLLGKIEAYAEAKKSFSFGDIFMIVSPRRFTPGAINAIGLQNEQENYIVFPLDGGDIFTLENSQTPKDRLRELQDQAKQAEIESKRGKARKSALEQTDNPI